MKLTHAIAVAFITISLVLTAGSDVSHSDFQTASVLAVADSATYNASCSHEVGGWCRQFETLDEARQAERDHREATGHTDTSSGAGPCPF